MGVYPSACNLEVTELNWKVVCAERRTYRLEGGKGREALPIHTFRQDRTDQPIEISSKGTDLYDGGLPTFNETGMKRDERIFGSFCRRLRFY
jgi:hypothetical protein